MASRNRNRPIRSLTRAAAPALAAVAAAGAFAMVMVSREGLGLVSAALPTGCVAAAERAGPLKLVDTHGVAVTERHFEQAPALVYFGYTSCPDACPLALVQTGDALAQLGPAAQRIQTLLITLDPARDTPDALAMYVQSSGFPANLQGFTGSAPDIQAALSAFGAIAVRRQQGDAPYTIDHTSFLYVLGEDWRLRGMIQTSSASPEAIRDCIAHALGDELV